MSLYLDQIEWHLVEAKEGRQVDLNIDSALSLLKSDTSPLERLTSRERLKGTGDVLKDLTHAQQFADGCAEGGFATREMRFIDRALRVAIGEIKELRRRLGASEALGR